MPSTSEIIVAYHYNNYDHISAQLMFISHHYDACQNVDISPFCHQSDSYKYHMIVMLIFLSYQ